MKAGLAEKATILIAAGIAVLVAIVTASWLVAARAREYADEVRSERTMRTAALSTFISLLNAETSQRGYMLTGKENYLKYYTQTLPQLGDALKRLEDVGGNSSVPRADITSLADTAKKKLDELKLTVDTFKSGSPEKALEIVRSDQGLALMDEARGKLDPIIKKAETTIEGLLTDLDASSTQLIVLNILGGLVLIGLAGAAYYIVAKNTEGLVKARQVVESLNSGLEGRVADRTMALTRANEEIQRFAYIVSHDLRAPLVNIMGFTSELETGATKLNTYFTTPQPSEDITEQAAFAAKEDLPEALQFIRASTAKMDRLITSILKLSREGRRQLKRERIDLTSVLEASAASVRHQTEASGAEIRIEAPLPSIVADRLAIEQVFGNLIDNAVKYLSSDRRGLITVASEEAGGRVKITVADNGRGIDKADKERVFELFRRAGQQDKPGEGVGLAHVRALVRRMGGDVTVTSEFGVGSTFEVDLPKKATIKEDISDSE